MKKAFDCVEMKRKGQDRIRKELEGKSLEEQLAYWDRHAQRLREQQKSSASATRKKSA